MTDDEPRRRQRIPTTRASEEFFERYGLEAADTCVFTLRLHAMRQLLDGDYRSVPEGVLLGIRRQHDDMMVRLAMIPARTSRDLDVKVGLLEGWRPAMPENALLPHMISAALVENAVRLAIPDPPAKPRRRKK